MAKDKTYKRSRWIVLALASVAVVALIAVAMIEGCKPRTSPEASEMMNRADAVMEARPDSALTLLESVDTNTVRGKADRARYALLMSMALDKNYIDTTTFAILRPAINYYEKHGTPDERLKTRYYEGRIYMNRGDDDAALTSFLRAAEDSARCTDRRALARLLIAEGNMYNRELEYVKYILCNLKAADIYLSLGDSLNYYNSIARSVVNIDLAGDSINGEDVLNNCIEGLIKYGDKSEVIPSAVFSTIPTFKSKSEFLDIFSKIEKDSIILNSAATELACAFSSYDMPDKAMEYLKKGDTSDSLHYLAVKSEILESNNNLRGALDAYKEYLRLEEQNIQNLLNSNLLFTRKQYAYDLERALMASRNEKKLYFSIGVFLLLILFLMLAVVSRYAMKLRNKVLNNENKLINAEKEKLEILTTSLQKDLNEERINLEEMLSENQKLSDKLRILLNDRLAVLQNILSVEPIQTSSEESRKTYNYVSATMKLENEKFLKSIMEGVRDINPKFMELLEERSLTQYEIDYVCLYCLGLKGREVGIFLGTKNHYIYSNSIRQKLHLDADKRYLGKILVDLYNSYLP